MKRNINYKTGYKKVKIADIIRVLLTIHNRIPEGQALTREESICSGKDILTYGSDMYIEASKQKYGYKGRKVFISSKDLTPFADYLIEHFTDNEWVKNTTVNLFTHRNQKPPIEGALMKSAEVQTQVLKKFEQFKLDVFENCETMEADFAEIEIITEDKTIRMLVNYKPLFTRQIGTYVEVHDTSWKKLKPIEDGQSKKDWILDRLIIEAATILETSPDKRFKTKEEFLKYFNSVYAHEPSELIKNIIKYSKLTRDGGMRVWNMEELSVQYKLGILKMFYNKIKNDTLKVTVAEGKDDKTHVELLYNGRKLGLWTSFKNKVVEYEG